VWQIFLAYSLGLPETDPRRAYFLEDQAISLGDPVMHGIPKMSREQYIESMRGRFEAILGGVADAVNEAPDGPIINASEERVRDLFAEFRRVAYEAALQGRVDAAEAASPPSAGA